MASAFEGFLSVAVLGLASLLLLIATASWRRVGGQRLAILAAAFGLFAVKGILYLLNQFQPFSPFDSWPLAFDFGTLLLLYIGTLR